MHAGAAGWVGARQQKQAPRCGLGLHGPDPARLYKVSLGAGRAVPQLYILTRAGIQGPATPLSHPIRVF